MRFKNSMSKTNGVIVLLNYYLADIILLSNPLNLFIQLNLRSDLNFSFVLWL